MTSSSSSGSTRVTLQFDLNRKIRDERRARGAGRDQRRPRRPAAPHAAQQSDLSQDEPSDAPVTRSWP
ncbi:hypothetical protein ACRAWD_21345 [Caulobacter segnis]